MVRRLLYLNGIAILAVVVFHATGMGFVAMFAWTGRYLPPTAPSQMGSLPYYGLRLMEQLVVACIPAFIFVSGFFVAIAKGKQQPTVSWSVVLSRVKNLVIPYLVWTALAYGLKFLEGERYTVPEVLTGVLIGRVNPVLYFIPLIVQMYLLGPILVPIAQKHWKWLLLVSGVILIAVQIGYYPILLNTGPALFSSPSWFFPFRLFWFVFGMVTAFHLDVFKQFLARWRGWLLLLGILLIPLGMLEWEWMVSRSPGVWLDHRETFVDTAYSLAVLLAFLGYSQVRLPLVNVVNILGASAFGIYLSHAFVVEYSARLIYRFLPSLLGYQVILQPLLIALGVGIPLLMMEFTRRTPLRVVYKYVFG